MTMPVMGVDPACPATRMVRRTQPCMTLMRAGCSVVVLANRACPVLPRYPHGALRMLSCTFFLRLLTLVVV